MNPHIPILVPFLFALSILMVFAVRGITWNRRCEENRLKRIQNIGLNRELRSAIVYPFFLASVVIYLGPQLLFPWFWKAFGFFLISLLALAFLISLFANWQKPNAEETKEILKSNKRIRNRRIGGLVYILVSVLWLYSGYEKVI